MSKSEASVYTGKSTFPINVAHFHSSNGVYGAERWTTTQIKYLNKSVVAPLVVTIGTKKGSKLFHDYVANQGYDVAHLAISGKLNFDAIISLRKLLVERDIDILHTHGFKSDIIGYLASRFLPLRLVSTPHGWSADEGSRIRVYEAISRVFLKRFCHVYPLSPALRDDLLLRGFSEDRLRLILNAVDTNVFDLCFANRECRQPDDPLHILFVGRLCRPKGVYDLLDAFAIARLNCGAELHLVGDGPEKEDLQAYSEKLGIDSRVRFVGSVSQVEPHFRWSDVLILPSYSEGIPRVVMEAFAAGVPVIGSAIPGIQHLVRDGSTGLLVTAGLVTSLAEKIERVAKFPMESYEMSVKARQLVLEKYSAIRQAIEFQEEYERLVMSVE
jgi:glycosyltransferase involved in cell wall biosynthesis